MRKMSVVIGILQLLGTMALAQSGPFNTNAVVSLNIQPSSPTVGGDFTVDVYASLQGITNSSAVPAALGALIIPLSFDSSRVTLKSVATDTDSAFGSDLTFTDISRANARGFVALVAAQAGAGTPIGNVHVATLTFTANQGGTVLFAVNSSRSGVEGSLSSTYDPTRGGPALIPYNDQVTAVQINTGGTTYHLTYPSFVSSAADFQGVTIVNESSTTSSLTFRAYGVDGKLLSKAGMSNPSTLAALNGNTQYAKVVEEMFTLSDSFGSDHGWVDAESTSPDISGFFLIGHTANGVTTELDGADVSPQVTSHAIFPVLGKHPARGTDIFLVNPASNTATGSMKLQSGGGATQQTFRVSIPPHGVFEQSFQSDAVSGNGYIEVEMSSGMVTGLEKFGIAKELACLTAQDANKASNVLYAPHFASGPAGARYFTDIGVINPSSQAVSVKFHLLDDQGIEVGSPVTQTVKPKGLFRTHVDQLFSLPDPGTSSAYYTGVIKVECDTGLVGNVIFGDIDGNFMSSLPLLATSGAKREFYLDYVALGTIPPISYWTGVAILNASQERDAHVTLKLYGSKGNLVAQTSKTFARKSRLIDLLSGLDPRFNVNQFGGFIHVTSDVELFTFMLIGDTAATFLAAVPVR